MWSGSGTLASLLDCRRTWHSNYYLGTMVGWAMDGTTTTPHSAAQRSTAGSGKLRA